MIIKLFSIHDTKAQSYSPPFSAATKAEAIRTFTAAVNEEGSFMGQHPADFILTYVGLFDKDLGILAVEPTEILATASDVRNTVFAQSANSVLPFSA